MSLQRRADRFLFILTVLASLVLLNIVGQALWWRVDLTRDKQYTLSLSTRRLLHSLTEPVTVHAYLTQDLPPPHASNMRDIKDLLLEYHQQAPEKLNFEVIDPIAWTAQQQKPPESGKKPDLIGQSRDELPWIEQELARLGIPALQIETNHDDRIEMKHGYMGMVVSYAGQQQIIPIVGNTLGLEYRLTSLIRKLAAKEPQTVGVVVGHGGPQPEKDLSHFIEALQVMYHVKMVDLQQVKSLEDMHSVLLIGPSKPFSTREKTLLRDYLQQGGSVAMLLGPIEPLMPGTAYETNQPELDDLLEEFGVHVMGGLCVDAACSTVQVAQNSSSTPQMQRYPLIPLLEKLPDHWLTREITQVLLPFTSPIEFRPLPDDSLVKTEVLVRSSEKSWVQKAPFNLTPLQSWTPHATTAMRLMLDARPLIVSITKTAAALPETAANTSMVELANEEPKKSMRLVLAGGHTFVTNQFFQTGGNAALTLNLVDWLMHNDDLLVMRSRGLAAPPLQMPGNQQRLILKYLNMLGLPLCFILVGLWRWQRRERRRLQVVLA